MSCFVNEYVSFENIRLIHDYHANSIHVIKSKYETSYQFANRISIFFFQKYDNHEFNDAYVNNAYHYAQSIQLLYHSFKNFQFLSSYQMFQIFFSSQTFKFSILNQIHSIKIFQFLY